MLAGLLLARAGALLSASSHRASHPALRLGGEWAGHRVSFSTEGGLQPVPDQYVPDNLLEWGQAPTGFEVLTTESWSGSPASLGRRNVMLLPEDGCNVENLGAIVSKTVLPAPCSGSVTLRPGNSMMEPETLNVRAWALDAVDEGGNVWRLETVFDGLGGKRPRERRGALDCPAERTRVQCAFDLESGTLVGSVHVWQERCWLSSPSEELQVRDSGRSGLDAAWVSSAVGLGCFGDQSPSPAAGSGVAAASGVAASGDDSATQGDDGANVLALAGGIELRVAPGLLDVTLKSGDGSRNSWSAVAMRRSWAGDEAGRSLFTEVVTYDETMGDD